VIRSLRDRLRAKFNVSVAETGLQDVHGRAVISIAAVGSDRRLVESMLEKADRLVEMHGGATIVRVAREVY
jgi:uncharacterized protein YlxP (DUF503 family)